MTRQVLQASDLRRGDMIVGLGVVEDIFQAADRLVEIDTRREDGGLDSKLVAPMSAFLVDRKEDS